MEDDKESADLLRVGGIEGASIISKSAMQAST